jgi:hypothetical protein
MGETAKGKDQRVTKKVLDSMFNVIRSTTVYRVNQVIGFIVLEELQRFKED